MNELERATNLVNELLDMRRKWGKNFGERDFNVGDLLDALVLIEDTASVSDASLFVELRAEIVKLNRQLGAAKSREKKAAKAQAVLIQEEIERDAQ